MQEQQSTVGSFTETHELLHGTTPNNTGGGHGRLCNMLNQAENRLLGHHPSELEGRRHGLTNHPSLESINLSLGSNQTANDSSSSPSMQFGRIPRNINLNAVYVGNSDGTDHVQESDVFPHQYKPGGSETSVIYTPGGPGNPSGIAFGSAGHVTVEGDGRPGCSSDGLRFPCKRKADDDVSDQSSQNGKSREQSAEDMVPARSGAYSSNVSFLSENSVAHNQQLHSNSQYEVGGRVVPSTIQPVVGAAGFSGDIRRSSRLRIDHGHLQDQHQVRVNGIGRTGSSAMSYTDYVTRDQHQSPIPIPGVQRTAGPLLREASSSTRFGSLASTMVGERPSNLPLELFRRNVLRAIPDLPMHIPRVHTTAVAQHPTNLVLANANISHPGRPGSISQVGSSSRAGLPARVPDYLTTIQHSRRLAGIRRTLLLATDSDSEEETINPVLSPAISRQGNHQPFQGPMFRSDAQADDDAESQVLSRALNAGRENRRRLLSEIHRAMDLFRSGRYPNLQNVNLPRSLVSGLLDIHDGHRNMRLDVDNMSYEELLALEDHIGNVTTGLSEEAIMRNLHRVRYLSPRAEHSEVEPCCICQEEIVDEEEIGMLDCGHDFHTACIKRWLMEKNLCPICKTTALVELPDV